MESGSVWVLMALEGKSGNCCWVAGLEVTGDDGAGVVLESGLFGNGGDEALAIGPPSENILNSVGGDSWKCVASCEDRGDCGVHSPED